MTKQDRGALALVRTALLTPEGRARVVTPLALAIIALTTGFRAWVVYRGGFFADDFVFLSDVARDKADPEWFLRRYNVHFMPLGFLLVIPVAVAGPFVWAAAATEIVVLQLLGALACWIMLRTLFGNTPRILVPLTFYAFSAIMMPAMMWWAASLNMLTVQTPLFLGIAAHVAYLRTSKKRFAIAAALCLVLALGFYVKAMFFPVAVGIFTLVYFVTGSPVRRLLKALKQWWFVWALYASIGTAFLIGYSRLGGSPAQTDGTIDLADVIQRQVVGSLGTGLLGGPWSWVPADIENGPRQLVDPPQLVQIISAVTIILLLAYFAGRYKGALRPLWFLVPCIAITVGTLAIGRVAVFGTAITQELRYWSDTLPYFTLAIGLICMALPGTPKPLELRADPIVSRRLPHHLVLALAAAYVIGSVVSTASYVSTWHDNYDAKAFTRTAAAQLESQPVPVALADEAVPESVMQSLTFPYNLTSRVMAPLNKHFTTPDIANDINVLDGYGQVVPGWATPDLDVPAENLKKCLGVGEVADLWTVDLGTKTFNFPFWASVTYRAAATTPVVVIAGEKRYNTTFLSGFHTLSFRTIGTFDTMRFSLPGNTRVCLESIRIGQRVVAR